MNQPTSTTPEAGMAIMRCYLLALFLGIATATLAAPAAGPATAQEFASAEPYFEAVGDSESIPYGVVTSLTQDYKGMLWIGTQVGLIRYDGYRFRKFIHDANSADSLSGDFIRAMFAASDGRLWLATNSNGVSVYDPLSERFTNYRHDPQIPGSINESGTVRVLAGNAAGDIWIGTDKGLDYLPHGSTEFSHYRYDKSDPASLADDRIRSLLFDSQGALWIGTASGLQRMRHDKKGFDRVASTPGTAGSLAGQDIVALFEAADGKLWVGTRNLGAAWLDRKTLQLHWLTVDPARTDRLSHGWINAIAQPQPGQIWLGSYGGGINVVAADDGRILQRLRHDASISSSLALDQIGTLVIDRSGLLLVGTWGGGLQRYNPRSRY